LGKRDVEMNDASNGEKMSANVLSFLFFSFPFKFFLFASSNSVFHLSPRYHTYHLSNVGERAKL
jgi:hypothetical protein